MLQCHPDLKLTENWRPCCCSCWKCFERECTAGMCTVLTDAPCSVAEISSRSSISWFFSSHSPRIPSSFWCSWSVHTHTQTNAHLIGTRVNNMLPHIILHRLTEQSMSMHKHTSSHKKQIRTAHTQTSTKHNHPLSMPPPPSSFLFLFLSLCFTVCICQTCWARSEQKACRCVSMTVTLSAVLS